MEDRVGTARSAAQTVVVELDQAMDKGRKRDAGCRMGALHVPKMARILNSHADIEWLDLGKTIEMVGQPFLDVDDSFGERCGLGSAQQVPVLFHRSTAPSRVDHDRASVAADRQRSDGGLRPTASIGAEPGMGMQCAAARGDIGRRRDAKPGGLDDPLTRMVDVSLPGIHDTAGEKEDIVTAG